MIQRVLRFSLYLLLTSISHPFQSIFFLRDQKVSYIVVVNIDILHFYKYISLSPQIFFEPPYIINNSHSNKISQILNLRADKMQASDFDERPRQVYKLAPSLLDRTPLTPFIRAKLFHWLSEETANQFFMRETYALTCYYIDLYFMNGNNVALDDLQSLGLAALILAAKQNQSKVPQINFRTFPKNELLNFESKLAFKLNFYLNPVTYIQQLEFLFRNWDQFTEKENIYPQVKYFFPRQVSYCKLKNTCQKMDCINLVAKMMKFNQNQIVLTLFYLQNRFFCIPLTQEKITSHQHLKKEFQAEDEYKGMFERFLEYCGVQTRPNIQIVDYIFYVILMKIEGGVPNRGVLTYIQFVNLMTTVKKSLSVAKKTIDRTREL